MIRTFQHYDLRDRNTFRMKVYCRTFIEYDSEDDLQELVPALLPSPDEHIGGGSDSIGQRGDYRGLSPENDIGGGSDSIGNMAPLKHIGGGSNPIRNTARLKHIGGGSNLLFTGDFPGTVLHSAIRHIDVISDSDDEVLVRVGSGVEFDKLCEWAAGRSLWGPENLSHIPGEAGAAAVQNIGAYGVEAKDIIREVRAFDLVSRKFLTFSVEECNYGYRDSFFKSPEGKDRYIITGIVFAFRRNGSPILEYGNLRETLLSRCPCPTPSDVREAIISIRRTKLPEVGEVGSAGSFFKNPVVSREVFGNVVRISGRDEASVPHYPVPGPGEEPWVKIPAAWLIDQCGWKGAVRGGAGVWPSQPLVIINASGEASPEEILALEECIRMSVSDRFGIVLSPEVEHIQ
ncbi:MAG: UDP-N-acetylmuramate dehydrogenase [Candidatus Cryptobacteroides sp.]